MLEDGTIPLPSPAGGGAVRKAPDLRPAGESRPVRVVDAKPGAPVSKAEALKATGDAYFNRLFPNATTGLRAAVDRDTAGKAMGGGTTNDQGAKVLKPNARVRVAAWSSLPELFDASVLTGAHGPRDTAAFPKDRNVARWLDFHVPFRFEGRVYPVRIRVKELRGDSPQVKSGKHPDRMHSYAIEAWEIENPAGREPHGGIPRTGKSIEGERGDGNGDPVHRESTLSTVTVGELLGKVKRSEGAGASIPPSPSGLYWKSEYGPVPVPRLELPDWKAAGDSHGARQGRARG